MKALILQRATVSAKANQIQNVFESYGINHGELSRKGKLGASSHRMQRIYTVKKERNKCSEQETVSKTQNWQTEKFLHVGP